MRPTTSNIFHTSLAFHPSTLTAGRSSMRVDTRGVGSQWCSTTGSRYGTRGIESSSWVVGSPALWRVPYGGNA
jgi:hypothetical protein